MTKTEFIEKYARSESDSEYMEVDLDNLLIVAKRDAWDDGYDEGIGECE